MILLAFTMPFEVALRTIANIYLPVLTIYPVGTVLLGYILIARLRRGLLIEKLADSEARSALWLIIQLIGNMGQPEGNFEYCSPSCVTITGHSAEEFLKNPRLSMDIIHPDDLEIFRKHHDSNPEAERENPVAFRIISTDGTIRWISHNCRPLHDQNGKFLGIRGSNRDITEKKRAEEALRVNEERYRTYTEKISDVIWFWTPKQCVLHM
jgi:PAS domain S-box-containing protein